VEGKAHPTSRIPDGKPGEKDIPLRLKRRAVPTDYTSHRKREPFRTVELKRPGRTLDNARMERQPTVRFAPKTTRYKIDRDIPRREAPVEPCDPPRSTKEQLALTSQRVRGVANLSRSNRDPSTANKNGIFFLTKTNYSVILHEYCTKCCPNASGCTSSHKHIIMT
jgi:hypothetical protein